MSLIRKLRLLPFLILPCTCSERSPYTIAMLGTEIEDIDPAVVNEYNEITLTSQVCGRLTAVDEAMNIVGDLALKWNVAPDGKSVLFEIDKRRRFVDGTTLHASDVAYSIQRLIEKAGVHAPSWTTSIESVYAPSDTSLQLQLKEPNRLLLFKLADPAFCVLSEARPFLTINGHRVPKGALRVSRASISIKSVA